MSIHPLAGQHAPPAMLVNIPRLITAYFSERPDASDPAQRVTFGTSGHRGSALNRSFNEAHIFAVTQAICDYRKKQDINGPLFLGMDTHALSEPAFVTALEVLAGNGVETMIAHDGGYTPTPAVSHAILAYNRGRATGFADGVVITPSHNPPEDGGIKYNPPHGGPSETAVSAEIEKTANRLLAQAPKDIKRLPIAHARRAATTHSHDYVSAYTADLAYVLDMDAIRDARLRVGADPLGGAGVAYWTPIAERYGLDIEVVNANVDPTFRFMPLDWDGRIRMDCSSPYAMAGLIALAKRFDIAFGNDTDHDRHGIVAPSSGLLNPNHYLAVAIDYLCTHRPGWPVAAAIGKTVVSSSLIDRVVAARGRRLVEVPVGFKWFVHGLHAGNLAFAGEESAGASFLRKDGTVWTTDKDGLLLGLLAAEMRATTGRDPGELYQAIVREHGAPLYERTDAPADREQKARLAKLTPTDVRTSTLAGERIEAVLTNAPGDGNAIGGVKVITPNGWFAARPSGTEAVYKLYAESFLGPEHLKRIQAEAQTLVDVALEA
ncbi:MAG: phosphoglucomutase (alpha-D-glucose-1,6-bisphosphate-dependent) [Sulfuricaulis sp.]|uniref:phosphoglucomutase (alpha-D-glucose-1,6-bisphosphate-dependent) n=1 Tax=Sulfuricaulis sp. TaxID=2003553 RepID=UPI003C4135F8